MKNKTLVVYFSRKGYTKRFAEKLAQEQSADLHRVTTSERTAGITGFLWCGRFGMHRWQMPINSLPDGIESYEHVIFCSPIWVFTFCAPMREFMSAACGKVKSAEYVFLHFSFPMSYGRSAKNADKLLGIKSTGYTSIQCMWGKFFKKRKFKC